MVYSGTQSKDRGWYWNSWMLSQSAGWLNGLMALRAPNAQKLPMLARAMKPCSFMPKYLPTTASGPIWVWRFEIDRAEQARLDDAGAGIETHDVVEDRRLARGVLQTVDDDRVVPHRDRRSSP